MRGLAIAAVIALAAPAHADDKAPSFEVRDRGDAVEVIAHNVKAARTAILPVRSRLEIPIVAGPMAKRIVPGDATVKLVEFDSDSKQQMLSVKLGYEKPEVKELARFAQAVQVGDDLHVIVPRKLPAPGTAPRLPEPSNLPVAAVAEPKAPRAEAKPPVEPKAEPRPIIEAKAEAKPPVEPKAEPKPIVEAKAEAKPPVEPKAEPRPIVAPVPDKPAGDEHKVDEHADKAIGATDAKSEKSAKPDKKPLKQALVPDADTELGAGKIVVYLVLGLAAAGLGVWSLRKKKFHLPTHGTIEVIAQRSLGGKARVVWLSAGQREMLVSVTAQQVQMLGQWEKTDPPLDEQLNAPADAPADGHDLRGALLGKLDKLHERVAAEAPRRQTATLEAQRRPTGAMRAQTQTGATPPQRQTGAMPAQAAPRRSTGLLPAQRPPTAQPLPPRRATGSIPAVQPGSEPALSPAVSGILRLRGRTNQFTAVNPDAAADVSADIASGDPEADELWAKEILAATGNRR